ncbi:hypothetical protein halTADL_0228 [Halohasta litchfieldiae]|jgi:Zn-dependent membrane protease YugP|uniref:Uncharacterized protein n=1 Tax=Halohasta litchfieldiae TaxID=1073996 RepID=A0A1H6WFL3_9EURY|nr:hypothetical protein [Halohasta litchfieldiae]ATW87049.1 hypothetical protein halTADL_0228 [Halohasta litchfieldiae]SEJ12887.1 hypothetical protein SAMN05444271_12337 [Halohasta litchfieldiae]
MVEVSGFEIVIASFFILIAGVVLSAAGLLEQGITLFVFMLMGLLGFLTVRAIRGRKFDWR